MYLHAITYNGGAIRRVPARGGAQFRPSPRNYGWAGDGFGGGPGTAGCRLSAADDTFFERWGSAASDLGPAAGGGPNPGELRRGRRRALARGGPHQGGPGRAGGGGGGRAAAPGGGWR